MSMPEEIRTNREEAWEDTQDYQNDLIIFHPEEYDEDLEEEISRRPDLFEGSEASQSEESARF